MQAGFATLSAGSIRAKNVSNILLKVRMLPRAPCSPRLARPMRARPERASLPFSLSRLYPSQNILDACIGCIAWFFLGELQKLQDGGRCPNSQRSARVLSVRVLGRLWLRVRR